MAVFWIDEPAQARAKARQSASGDSILQRTLGAFLWPNFRGLLLRQGGTQFVFSAAVGLLPIYLQDMARPSWLSPELASGLAITATAITAALSMPLLGRWVDRRGPRDLLIVSLAGSGAVLIVPAPLCVSHQSTVNTPCSRAVMYESAPNSASGCVVVSTPEFI